MNLVKKFRSKDFILKDWYMNSISLPSHKSDLPLGPYFNFIKKKEGLSNNWDSAFEMAFIIYVDLMNLLLEILDAMSNS